MKIKFSSKSMRQLSALLALASLVLVMSLTFPGFLGADNLTNVSRNFSFIGIVALAQTVVIISGGIDLSVGSIMGLSAIICACVLESGMPLWAGVSAGLGAALIAGLINGYLVAYARLPAFVVTLAMLSVARSLALVISQGKMIYEFGPDSDQILGLGGGSYLGLPVPVIVLLILTVGLMWVLKMSPWGMHVYALGGNEEALRANGIHVQNLKMSVYAFSAIMAGLSGILWIGFLGSVTSSLGTGYELLVAAAAVIGGASLSGGQGTALGALIGAILLEVIRNGLILAQVNPYWQGTFVGVFILAAVLLERLQFKRVA